MQTTQTEHVAKILVVDDDFGTRELLRMHIVNLGYRAEVAADGESALILLAEDSFDLVLLDMIMPGIDGYNVLSTIRADAVLRDIPVVMVSAVDDLSSVVRCIEVGADDYLSKPVEPALLSARLRAELQKKKFRDQEQEYLRTIEETQRLLKEDLEEAARYVLSILPQPESGRIKTDWCYLPCDQLGGDVFDYFWIDDDHFAIYLLDVCGHGAGAALLSVSLINVVRSGSLTGIDFRNPGQVLTGLNDAFPMERHNDMYFTMWYGVYHAPTRTIRYAGGGHPPALLVAPEHQGGHVKKIHELDCSGPLVGVFPGQVYEAAELQVPPASQLYVYCDGVYEIQQVCDGRMTNYEDFLHQLHKVGHMRNSLDAIVLWAEELNGSKQFEDDFSIVRLSFD